MADLAYTTAAEVEDLAGTLAVELRTDDAADAEEAAAMLAKAVDHGSARIDFYLLGRYAATELAANRWVRDVATLCALHWLCRRRLNRPPKSVTAEWEERQAELELVRTGKAAVPGAAGSRRPVTVTNQRVDLRRPNNQVRTDRSRSTGVAKDYRRPTDPNGEAVGGR